MITDDTIRAAFNTGGHPAEWTINVPGYNHERYIPRTISDQLAGILGSEFHVDNRGSRLEITSRLFDRGRNPIETNIVAALTQLGLGPVTVEIAPYQEPVKARRDCKCGCGQQLTMREVFEHLRAAKALTPA